MVLCFSEKPRTVELDSVFRIQKSSHSIKQSVKGIMKKLISVSLSIGDATDVYGTATAVHLLKCNGQVVPYLKNKMLVL